MSERLYGSVQVEDVAGFSVASDYHPERNEDTFFADMEVAAIGVFDGMGGHVGSEHASRAAAQAAREHFREVPVSLPRELGRQAVKDALLVGHDVIINDSSNDIGTTASVVKIFEDSSQLYAAVGHVGDSRAYLLRQGGLYQLTLDNLRRQYDNYDKAERLRDTEAWRLQENLSRANDISQLDAVARKEFRWRNVITSCLGDRDKMPYIGVTDIGVFRQDVLVVTSDGVHDNLTTGEIARIVRDAESAEIMSKRLVRSALERSRNRGHLRAKPDDITAVALVI